VSDRLADRLAELNSTLYDAGPLHTRAAVSQP
jgi:hypothetical protein